MEVNSVLSKNSTVVIRDALDAIKCYGFDAVDSVFLLSAFFAIPETGFEDYFLEKDVEERYIDETVHMLITDLFNDHAKSKKADGKEENKEKAEETEKENSKEVKEEGKEKSKEKLKKKSREAAEKQRRNRNGGDLQARDAQAQRRGPGRRRERLRL